MIFSRSQNTHRLHFLRSQISTICHFLSIINLSHEDHRRAWQSRMTAFHLNRFNTYSRGQGFFHLWLQLNLLQKCLHYLSLINKIQNLKLICARLTVYCDSKRAWTTPFLVPLTGRNKNSWRASLTSLLPSGYTIPLPSSQVANPAIPSAPFCLWQRGHHQRPVSFLCLFLQTLGDGPRCFSHANLQHSVPLCNTLWLCCELVVTGLRKQVQCYTVCLVFVKDATWISLPNHNRQHYFSGKGRPNPQNTDVFLFSGGGRVIGWICSCDLFKTYWEGSSPKRAECFHVCFHCLSGIVIITLNHTYCIRTYTPDAEHGELLWSGFGWKYDSHPWAHTTEAKYTGIMPVLFVGKFWVFSLANFVQLYCNACMLWIRIRFGKQPVICFQVSVLDFIAFVEFINSL